MRRTDRPAAGGRSPPRSPRRTYRAESPTLERDLSIRPTPSREDAARPFLRRSTRIRAGNTGRACRWVAPQCLPRTRPGQQQAFDAGPRTVLQEDVSKPIGGWFVVLRSREVPPYREIPLFEGNNMIGRLPDLGPQCLTDSLASEQHARIVVDKASCTLIDMGSKNGVTVNNQKIATHRLKRGDRVKIGKTTMVFIPLPDEKGGS